ncbi:hypothetical protein [Nostoc sp.]|uniref:hypothetical protein n=1 Tax=Nostoc sp. TaxID=1180 RepID=UPI002FFACD5E
MSSFSPHLKLHLFVDAVVDITGVILVWLGVPTAMRITYPRRLAYNNKWGDEFIY